MTANGIHNSGGVPDLSAISWEVRCKRALKAFGEHNINAYGSFMTEESKKQALEYTAWTVDSYVSDDWKRFVERGDKYVGLLKFALIDVCSDEKWVFNCPEYRRNLHKQIQDKIIEQYHVPFLWPRPRLPQQGT